jgi:hypothetical protein
MVSCAPSRSPEVAQRLSQFVNACCGDVLFRRQLRYRPIEALALHGLSTERMPKMLPIRHYETSVNLKLDYLFGPTDPVQAQPSASFPLEIRQVMYGLKPMALVYGPTDSLFQILVGVQQAGLRAILSPKLFRAIPDQSAGGYVNVAASVIKPDVASLKWQGLLVAKDWGRVELGWLALLFGWNELLGGLLGSPACCAAGFESGWREACRIHGGEFGAVLLSRHRPADRTRFVVRLEHYGINLFARYFGYHLLEHFPCRFDCPATVELSQRMAENLSVFEPTTASSLKSNLSTPLLFLPGEASIMFREGSWDERDQVLRYSSDQVIISNQQSALASRIASIGSIRVTDDGIDLGDERVAGWLLLS